MNYMKILLLFILAFFIVMLLCFSIIIIVVKVSNFLHDKRSKNLRYCNYCQIAYDKSWDFCGSCARELDDELYVKRCVDCDFTTDEDDFKFCPVCSKHLSYYALFTDEVEDDEREIPGC